MAGIFFSFSPTGVATVNKHIRLVSFFAVPFVEQTNGCASVTVAVDSANHLRNMTCIGIGTVGALRKRNNLLSPRFVRISPMFGRTSIFQIRWAINKVYIRLFFGVFCRKLKMKLYWKIRQWIIVNQREGVYLTSNSDKSLQQKIIYSERFFPSDLSLSLYNKTRKLSSFGWFYALRTCKLLSILQFFWLAIDVRISQP